MRNAKTLNWFLVGRGLVHFNYLSQKKQSLLLGFQAKITPEYRQHVVQSCNTHSLLLPEKYWENFQKPPYFCRLRRELDHLELRLPQPHRPEHNQQQEDDGVPRADVILRLRAANANTSPA